MILRTVGAIILFYWAEQVLAQADNREALRFTISLEKNTYLIDEPIYLEVLATNISNYEIAILGMLPNASWRYFQIMLKGQSDQPVADHSGELYMYAEPNWLGWIMASGERWLLVKDLLDVFGKWGDAAHQIRPFLPPGTYKVHVIYHTNPKAFVGSNRENEDKHTLYSNELQFEVIEPAGGLEKVAHEKLIGAFSAYENERPKPHRQAALFKEFIDKHPNSHYLPIAYFFLYMTYTQRFGNTIERQKLIEEMLTRFPNSGLTYQLLSYDRHETIQGLAKASSISKSSLMQKLNIASATSRASFYAQCLVDMQRIQMRTAERMKQKQEKR
jgi:hypothetical protein